MLAAAFGILSAAALIGAGLAVHFLRSPSAKRPRTAIPLVHGTLGIVGLILLVVFLRHGLPSPGNGTADFGPIAVGFFGAALLFGLLILLAAWRRGRPGGFLVATHASLAVAGVVMLLTLVLLG